MTKNKHLKLWDKAHKKRDNIAKVQERRIVALYQTMLNDYKAKLDKYSEDNMTRSELLELQRELEALNLELSKEVVTLIRQGIDKVVLLASSTTVEMLLSEYKGDKELIKSILDNLFNSGNKNASKAILNGTIYKDGKELSERIWMHNKIFNNDVKLIISKGIATKKSSYEIAKDIEKYVNPKVRKSWYWKGRATKNEKIEYNSQRAARTAVNHAWQEVVKENCRRNPYTTYIEWRSALAHGRTCEQCRSRDGQRYLVDQLPYDHPMGLCVMVPVLDKSLEEIAIELKKQYG